MVLDEVQRWLMDQIQRHNVRATALQVHVLIVHRRLMPTAIGVLDHELKLGQALRNTTMPVHVPNILLDRLLFHLFVSLVLPQRLLHRHEQHPLFFLLGHQRLKYASEGPALLAHPIVILLRHGVLLLVRGQVGR